MLFLLIFLFLASPALAVVNPQSGSAAVTATVPDRTRPDTPVLISPNNNSTISTAAPTFIFSPSGGETLVSHYQLWLDGVKNTDHIPQSYSTIITQALSALTSGPHTWMIKAVGINYTERDSAIWTFTIDATAPLILVDQVAEHETNLSSLDLSPWQNEVKFATSQRYPLIAGQSESNALLSITFDNETVTVLVGSDRLFRVKPKTALTLGRRQVSVSSADAAGNNTSLPSFYLDIVSGAGLITIPPPSPLPDLKFTIPVIIPPSLPEIITAIPFQPECPCSWLPWLIIILLIIYIIISKRRR